MKYDKNLKMTGVIAFIALFGISVVCAQNTATKPPKAPSKAKQEQPNQPTELPLEAPSPPTATPTPVPATTAATPAPEATAATTSPTGEELVYLNVQDGDIKDVIKQISKATGRNFIIDDKVKGKVTIISERPMTREEAYQTFLSALEVAGYTIVKGPAGVIKIISLKDAVQEPIPTHVDTTPVTDMFITRLIPLQNISAVEMSNAIKGLVSREGNLFAYPATNTLIITDSGTNIDRLMKIIKELDQEGPQQVLEIIPIANASARDVSQMVNQLFDQQKAAGAKPAGKKGGELEEMAEVSKIIADERTNSIIVLASRRAIDKVRGIIQKLDRSMAEGQEGKIHVYYLRHAKAKTMAETLSTLTSGAGASKKDAKAAASSGPIVAEFEGGVKITADESTNSLIITSSAKDFQTLIDKVISKLDIPRRQVYLEAVVMELSVRKGSELGMGGAFGGGGVGPFNVFGTTPYGDMLGGFMSGNPTFPAGLIGGLLGKDTIPITIGDQTKNIPSAGIFFTALSTYGDANVISTPSILTMDNEEAKIEVKGTEYYKTLANATAVGNNFSVNSSETGLILKITPQIGEANNVALKIEQSLSNVSGKSADPQVPNPTKERKVNTSVVTHEGQTVIIGGLMEDILTTRKRKIPILGDIPILGNLFKSTEVDKQKVNLLIFITPHILKDPSDFTAILKRKIEERNNFIDDNYGRKQRQVIRNSIQAHRADLLEFKEGKTGGAIKPTEPQAAAPIVPTVKQPVITAPAQPQTELGETKKMMQSPAPPKPMATVVEPVKAPTAVPSTQSAPSAPAPQGKVKAPVITVPPPAPGARGEDLDLAY